MTSDKLRDPSGCWTITIDDVSKAGFVFRDDLGETSDVVCVGGALKRSAPVAGELSVFQISPNPATDRASFAIDLPTETHVVFRIHDVTGRLVRTLWNDRLSSGATLFRWDGSNDNGDAMPSGIYFYRAVLGQEERTEKLILLR